MIPSLIILPLFLKFYGKLATKYKGKYLKIWMVFFWLYGGVFYWTGKGSSPKEKRHEKGHRKPGIFPAIAGKIWPAVPSIESMDRTAVWIGQPRVRSTAASGSGRRHRPPGPQTGSPPRYRRRPARSPRGHGRPERPGNGCCRTAGSGRTAPWWSHR